MAARYILNSLLLVTMAVSCLAAEIRPAADCTGPYTKLVGNICYEMYTATAAWNESASLCKADGGNLVSITNSQEQQSIEALLKENNVFTPIWTGASLENSERQSGKPTNLWRLVPKCWACDIPTICNANRGTGTDSSASTAGSATSTDEVGNLNQGGLDICFTLDNSGSISDADWKNTLLEVVVSLVDRLEIGSALHQSQVAAVKFGNVAELEFYLNQHLDKTSLKSAIRSIVHQPENTNTSAGIHMCREQVHKAVNGDRRGAQNIDIIITDGKSTHNNSETINQAQLSKDEGIITFVVGITGNVSETEIRGISDSPQREGVTYWKVPSFTAVTENVIQQIFDEVCKWQTRNWMMTRTAIESQGCYNEPPVTSWRQSLDLPVLVGSSYRMTIDMCISQCKEQGFDYAAPQNSECYCGNEYGKNGISNSCNTACPGDSTQICGGPNAINVYYVSGTKQGVWSPNEPSNDFYAWCGVLKHSDYKYASKRCTDEYRFHCKLPLNRCTNPSNDGTYQTISNLYCLYTSDSKEMWHSAREQCMAKQGDLLTLDTENERQLIMNALLQSDIWDSADAFSHIGLYKKNYFWTNEDDQAGRDLTFVHFDPDSSPQQPLPTGGDCIQMDRSPGTDNIYWSTANCVTRKNFVCQWLTDGSTTSSTTTKSTTTTTTTQATTTIKSTINVSTQKATTSEPSDATTIGLSGPGAGASTNNESGGLSITYIILIVICVILFILIVAILIWFLCGRNKTSHTTIHPQAKKYDARPVAPVPETGDLGYSLEEGMDAREDYDYGSTTGIIRR